MGIIAAGVTDVGCVRKHNEDSLLSDPVLGLFVVADGLGGHAAGEGEEAQVGNLRGGKGREGEVSCAGKCTCVAANTRVQARSKTSNNEHDRDLAASSSMRRGVTHVRATLCGRATGKCKFTLACNVSLLNEHTCQCD